MHDGDVVVYILKIGVFLKAFRGFGFSENFYKLSLNCPVATKTLSLKV